MTAELRSRWIHVLHGLSGSPCARFRAPARRRAVPGRLVAACLLAASLAGPPSLAQDGDSASYRMTFQGVWTRSVTPDGLPPGAHFSPLIGSVHNEQTSFWRAGERATPEMERVAELGRQANLAALMSRDPHVLAVLERFLPGGGTVSTTIEFQADKAHPLVTMVTMIAPSPDWFVGVSGLSLLDSEGNWSNDLDVDLFPYDAGTEEGTEFSLSNPPTVPQGTIMSIRGTGKFTDLPMATLTLERLDRDDEDDPDDGEDPEEPEPRFVGDVAAEPSGDSAITVFWRGKWADGNRGVLSVEARSQQTDWTPLVTVDASDGQVRIDGLETEAPYTFRLRGEQADGGFEYSEQISATTGADADVCRSGEGFLCLREDRFEVQVHWKNNHRAGDHGIGRSVPVEVSDESGLFWFFNPDNIELVVKVLDGRMVNDSHWVFFGALSDVEYWVTVRDVAGGARRTYHNPQGRICGQNDTGAFSAGTVSAVAASPGGSGSMGAAGVGVDLVRLEALPFDAVDAALPSQGGGGCEPGPERLCVLDNRFSLEVRFIDPNESRPGVDPEKAAMVLDSLTTAETGFFWFFNPSNIELAAKVLDGRLYNGRFWLLYGGVSDVEYTLTVSDTVTGLTRNYTNEQGSICGEIDTVAF